MVTGMNILYSLSNSSIRKLDETRGVGRSQLIVPPPFLLFLGNRLDCFIKIVVYGLWISPHKNTRSTYQLLVQPWLKWLAFPWKNTATTTTPTSTTTATDDASLTSSHDHRAYLNSFGNVLDLMSVVCYWIDLGIMLYGYPYCSVFKALAAARPLRLLSVLPGTAVSPSLSLLRLILKLTHLYL